VCDRAFGVAHGAERQLDVALRAVAGPGLDGGPRRRLGEHAVHQGLVTAESEAAEGTPGRLGGGAAEEGLECRVDIGDRAVGRRVVEDGDGKAAGVERAACHDAIS